MVMGPGFGIVFQLFNIMFFLVFGLALATVLISLLRGAKEWNKNNHSPRLTVQATVVTKRTNVTGHRHKGANGYYRSATTYYATFEVESGDRMELQLEGFEYGLLVEGDKGKLSFQGTRYLGFERT